MNILPSSLHQHSLVLPITPPHTHTTTHPRPSSLLIHVPHHHTHHHTSTSLIHIHIHTPRLILIFVPLHHHHKTSPPPVPPRLPAPTPPPSPRPRRRGGPLRACSKGARGNSHQTRKTLCSVRGSMRESKVNQKEREVRFVFTRFNIFVKRLIKNHTNWVHNSFEQREEETYSNKIKRT